MLQAEIRGKLPEVQNAEDVLTSNVFGLLKYISQKDLLINILACARTITGKVFLECIGVDLGDYSQEYFFWEKLGKFGEPDIFIKFQRDRQPSFILGIEVKYYYSKHGEGDDDQLKRYFEGMDKHASLKQSNFLGLIYLTKYPSNTEIEESLKYISELGIPNSELKLSQFWEYQIQN
jgi:hypothetical protein